ncbi:MAG: CoA transferase [Actinomycetota bacterium]
MKDVLRGIRVLDFCWVGAGALVTKLLAEHGADVIKVESHARPDNLRVAPPYRPGAEGLEGSGYFASRNNDKRSLALDLRQQKSREIAKQLAAQVDVVANNFRPGVMERWGLDYASVAEVNPSVVYLSMPMQGSDGPHRNFIGFGATIAALAGLVELSGLPDRPPVGTGTHYPDHVPSPGHALVALLATLRQRAATGRGRWIDVSQLESAANMIGPALVAAANGEPVPTRTGNRHPQHCPSGVFRCTGDESWIAVAARTDAEWTALVDVLQTDELRDPRYETFELRKQHEDDVERIVGGHAAQRGCRELAEALQAAGVPAYPVLSSKDVLDDEQLRARGFWRTLEHPVIGFMTAPSTPFVNNSERTGPVAAAPLLGEHTSDVAHELLGLDDAQVETLTEEGVFW